MDTVRDTLKEEEKEIEEASAPEEPDDEHDRGDD